jgi:hypothetical protein
VPASACSTSSPTRKPSVAGPSRHHETLQRENYFEKFVGPLDQRRASVRLPMKGAVESLNVCVAPGICLDEAWRQRR